MIRLGLFGCGNMARSFSNWLSQENSRAKVTACVDIHPERAEAVAKLVGAPIAATDYRQVLGDIDAALLVLPHQIHYDATLACLNAGKHVMVEKPMANTEKECLDMIAAAEKNKRILMVAYVMRFHPLVLKLKELIDSGKFGQCFHMSIWTEQFTQYPQGHWATDPAKLGGGQLFSHGCHYVDLLLWFLGKPVSGGHMGTNFGTPWMGKEGTSDMSIKFESGAVGYHFGTWGARGTRLGYSMHAHCTEGMLELALRQGQIIFHRFNRKLEGSVEPHIEEATKTTESRFGKETVLYEFNEQGKRADQEVLHFIDCIERQQRPETDGPRSLQSLRVIWKMYEAEQRGVVADLRGLGLDEADGRGKAMV